MTAENWRGILGEIVRSQADAEAENLVESKIALTRAGFLAGQQAVEALLADDRAQGRGFRQSTEAFAGWVGKDSVAAWDWLSNESDVRVRSALLPQYSSGDSDESARQIMDRFSAMTPDERSAMAKETTLELIESAGYEAADDLLDRESANDHDVDADESTRQAIVDVLMQQRQTAVANGGSPQETCDWLATCADRLFVRTEHFVEAASQLNALEGPAAAAQWLASITSAKSDQRMLTALGKNLEQWTTSDPDQAAKWVSSQFQHSAYKLLISRLEEASLAADAEGK